MGTINDKIMKLFALKDNPNYYLELQSKIFVRILEFTFLKQDKLYK